MCVGGGGGWIERKPRCTHRAQAPVGLRKKQGAMHNDCTTHRGLRGTQCGQRSHTSVRHKWKGERGGTNLHIHLIRVPGMQQQGWLKPQGIPRHRVHAVERHLELGTVNFTGPISGKDGVAINTGRERGYARTSCARGACRQSSVACRRAWS